MHRKLKLPTIPHLNTAQHGEFIRNNLNDACEQLRVKVPDLYAIILYGSLTTQSFKMTKHENQTYNFESDIDLIGVVPTGRYLKERLKSPKLCWKLQTGLTIDVHLETKYTLHHPPNIMESHNIYKSGITLYGKELLTPSSRPTLPPLSAGQALRLLCNRLWGILKASSSPHQETHLLIHSLYKGLMACYQAELILHQEYEVMFDLVLTKVKQYQDQPKELLSETLQQHLRSHFTEQKNKSTQLPVQELLPTVLDLIFIQVKKILQPALNQQITTWQAPLATLPKTNWKGGKYWENWALFTFRKIIRYQKRSSQNFFQPISRPVCLRIWSGWLALGLALMNPEKDSFYLDIYNDIMGWFPEFQKTRTLKEAISTNTYWQGMVPVTTRI